MQCDCKILGVGICGWESPSEIETMLLTLEWFSRIKPVVTKCIFFLTKAIESKHAERVVWGQGGFQFEEGRKSEDQCGRRIQEIDKTSELL